MGKVSAIRKTDSPRWKACRYRYQVSTSLFFEMETGEFPYVMAYVGATKKVVYSVLPTCVSRLEQTYIDECERLAGQFAGVSAMLACLGGYRRG